MFITSLIIITFILLIWIQFYRHFFWKKEVHPGYKLLFILFIIAINGGSLFILNFRYFKSSPESPLVDFSEIDVKVSLKYASTLLRKGEQENFSARIETRLLHLIHQRLNQHKIPRNSESTHTFTINIKDLYARTVIQDKYLIQVFFDYVYLNHPFSISTAITINQPKEFDGETYIAAFNTALDRLFKTLNLMKSLKRYTPDEVREYLETQNDLSSSDYGLLLNLLTSHNQQVSDKTLLKMIQTEDIPLVINVLGYALEHNRCRIMKTLTNYLFYAPKPILYQLMAPLEQSQCSVVEGFFWVLSHSPDLYLAEKALKHLQQFYGNRLDTRQLIYNRGKRVD